MEKMGWTLNDGCNIHKFIFESQNSKHTKESLLENICLHSPQKSISIQQT